MTLTYHDVLTTDLSPLLTAAEEWQRMGRRFGTLQGHYQDHVQGALHSGGWAGLAFDTQRAAAADTAFEYGAAETEATAVSRILHAAYQELTERQHALRHLVEDAEENGFTVDAQGFVRYAGYDGLTPADRHDPDYQRLALAKGQAADERTADIRRAVQEADESDHGVALALMTAATDISPDGSGVGGFNANAASPVGPAADDGGQDGTHKGGWHADGSIDWSTTPEYGRTGSLTPKAGKEMSFKEYLTLASISGQGSVSNGPFSLSGNFSVAAQDRMFATLGFTDKGVKAQLEFSAGVRAAAAGQMSLGQDVGVYGRANAFVGAEVTDTFQAGPGGVNAAVKGFVGEKAGGTVGVETGGIGVGFNVDGSAGAGYEGKLEFGPDPDTGKWKFGAKIGVTPGIGGSVGFEFTFDPHKFTHAVDDVTSAGSDALHEAGDVAKSTGHALKNAATLGGLI